MSGFTFESELKKEVTDFNKELDRLMSIYGLTGIRIVLTKQVGKPARCDITHSVKKKLDFTVKTSELKTT